MLAIPAWNSVVHRRELVWCLMLNGEEMLSLLELFILAGIFQVDHVCRSVVCQSVFGIQTWSGIAWT